MTKDEASEDAADDRWPGYFTTPVRHSGSLINTPLKRCVNERCVNEIYSRGSRMAWEISGLTAEPRKSLVY